MAHFGRRFPIHPWITKPPPAAVAEAVPPRYFGVGSYSWIPADDGIENGILVIFEAVGAGGHGAANTTGGAGGGGGGGEKALTRVFIEDASQAYSITVEAGGSVFDSSVVDAMVNDVVRAKPGSSGGESGGGAGGTGGTGDELQAGGTGGTASADAGGGGGSSGGDRAVGNSGANGGAGTGGAGGAAILQFETSGGGGGKGGDSGQVGSPGEQYGGGGGGGGDVNQAGGAGKDGRVKISWFSSLLFDNGGVMACSDIVDGYG